MGVYSFMGINWGILIPLLQSSPVLNTLHMLLALIQHTRPGTRWRSQKKAGGRDENQLMIPYLIVKTNNFNMYLNPIPYWLVVFRHLSEKYDFVNWDDDRNPIYFWENAKFMATSHHQPVFDGLNNLEHL